MGRPIAEPELHLLPDGFIGPVTLRHGVAGAPALPREGPARVYRVPPSGVVVTSSPPNIGIRDPDKMRFCYAGSASTALPIDRPGARADDGRVAILGGWQVRGEFHYVVDEPRNLSRYPNPALIPSERVDPVPMGPGGLIAYALYPILFARRPVEEVERAAQGLLVGAESPDRRAYGRRVVAAIRAELDQPVHKLRALLGSEPAFAEDVVSESDLREYLAALADRLEAGGYGPPPAGSA